MTKRPAFQFYPGDWRKDVELRSCSIAARGLWIELMCVAHECEPYGHLAINGKAMTPAQISGQTGVPAAQVKRLLDELITNGVARQTEHGVIYSKRMVGDERVRNARAEGGKSGAQHGVKGGAHGSKGGRPRTNKGGYETPLETPLANAEEPPPSSSSSSSDSSLRSESLAARAGTQAGQACRLMREAGIARTNPSDPRLLQLLSQGVTPRQLGDLATELREAGNAPETASYVLKAMEGRLRAAAAMPQHPDGTAQRIGNRSSTPTRQERISATVAELTGRTRHEPEVIDVVATERTSAS